MTLDPSSGGNNIMSARVPTPEGNYPVRGSYSGQALRNEPEVQFISDEQFEAMQAGSTKRTPTMHYPQAGVGPPNKARVGVAVGSVEGADSVGVAAGELGDGLLGRQGGLTITPHHRPLLDIEDHISHLKQVILWGWQPPGNPIG